MCSVVSELCNRRITKKHEAEITGHDSFYKTMTETIRIKLDRKNPPKKQLDRLTT